MSFPNILFPPFSCIKVKIQFYPGVSEEFQDSNFRKFSRIKAQTMKNTMEIRRTIGGEAKNIHRQSGNPSFNPFYKQTY